jgi:hypothetical protein
MGDLVGMVAYVIIVRFRQNKRIREGCRFVPEV